MNLNSNPAFKRLKAETSNTPTGNTSSNEGITGSVSAGSEVALNDNDNVVNNTFVNVFTVDILPVIFDNLKIFKQKDLLNLRLVSRCWRDAATSVLLKRNLCEIALTFGKVDPDKKVLDAVNRIQDDGNAANEFKSYKYYNAYPPKGFLADLSALISTSPKFPSNNFYFTPDFNLGLGNLSPPSGSADDANEHQKDLFQFLSLYGKKTRKLSISSGISKKAVQNLLYVHMPHLISLDLLKFIDFLDDTDVIDEKEDILDPNSKPPLEIREIFLGFEPELLDNKSDFLKQLKDASPNLCAFQSVGVSALAVLLEMGKCHLVKNLHLFDPRLHQLSDLERYAKLLTNTKIPLNSNLLTAPIPKLSHLTIMLKNRWTDVNTVDAIKYFNIILSASNNSLKYLELHLDQLNPDVNIFIPPLPHLKCFRLVDYLSSVVPEIHFLGDVIGEGIQAGKLTVNQSVGEFNTLALQNQRKINNIPHDYFPCLRKMDLYRSFEAIGEMGNDPQKLMTFFSLEQLGPDGVTTFPGDTLLTVTQLKLTLILPDEISPMSALFPNVSQLKITVPCSNTLRNCIWATFPKLEKIEIYILHHAFSGPENPGGNSKMLDSFFTGFSSELCAKLESNATLTELQSLFPMQVFKRTQPYIGSCKNLNELKIRLRSGLSREFVSKVTAFYGFQDVFHRTRIIFSFESISSNEIEDTHRNLEPVAAYVEIQMKK